MKKLFLFLALLVASTVQAKPVEVYETNFLAQPFAILGKVHAKSSTPKQLSKKIKEVASKYDGDAVLNYRIENTGAMSWWTGGQVSYAEGIVVKYSEDGITKIAEGIPIPVLE